MTTRTSDTSPQFLFWSARVSRAMKIDEMTGPEPDPAAHLMLGNGEVCGARRRLDTHRLDGFGLLCPSLSLSAKRLS